MAQIPPSYSIKFSKQHLQIRFKNNSIRPSLRTPCVQATSNRDNDADEYSRKQIQEPGSGRREPPRQRGGGSRSGSRGRYSPQRQESQQYSPRDTNGSNVNSPSSPKYDMLIVVEGINDMKAVRKTLNADVSCN
jgi:hypothetical protein